MEVGDYDELLLSAFSDSDSMDKPDTISTYKGLLITAALVFLADQLSKIWIFRNLEIDKDYITVIDNFFYTEF